MHVVIFEGAQWPTFAPLSLSRPVFSLPCGAGTLLDKQIRHLAPTRLSLWVRPELAEFCRQRIVPKLPAPATVNEPLDDAPALLVSGRTLHFGMYEYPNQPSVALDEQGLICSAHVQMAGLTPADALTRSQRFLSILDLPQMPIQSRMAGYVWDLVKWNEEALVEDLAQTKTPSAPMPAGPYHIIEGEPVHLGSEVNLQPGVVLDASHGPVMIGDHATIGANSVLQGPCFVGPYAVLRPLTLIRPGTTIGAMCKVGGEVANSIIGPCSNKAHDGYLGDSLIGQWVNLGAMTTTSNLKNTYGGISLTIGSRTVKTGRRFLGAIIGDHTKTAIGTRLMSGTYLGFCCMLAGSQIVPKFVPSFTFLTDKGQETYDRAKAIEVMKTVFARREMELTEVDQQVVAYAAEAAKEVER